ncbi:MAG: hypothetical protein RLZZ40_1170, partial [Actinomycetota bacterium]
MFSFPPRLRFTAATEVVALVLVVIGAVSLTPAQPVSATMEQPTVAYSIAAPTGITIDSPWVTDATGNTAWALGVNSAGTGVLARRDLATAVITTTPTLAGEIGATDGRLVSSSGYIAFLAKRQGAGGRVVVINPTTGVRVSSYDLTAADTNPKGIASNSTGASLFIGSNTASSQIARVTTATGAANGSFAITGTPVTSGQAWLSKFAFVSGGGAPKLFIIKDGTSVGLDSTTTLTGLTQNLVDPILVGNVGWYGTDTAPGRLVAIDYSTKSVTANFALGPTDVGLRNITLAPSGTFVYATTVNAGQTQLVALRLSDGVRLGTVDLGAITGATSISFSGRYVDVMFSGATAVIRTTTAAAPNAPTNFTAVESDRALTLSWTASISEEPLVTYHVTVAGSAAECTTTTTTCTIAGLTNGTHYSLSIAATSYAGTSASATVSASPATFPSAPVNPVAVRGDGHIVVSWEAAADGGRPLLDYTVVAQPGAHSCTTSSTHCDITGLVNGTDYSISVSARTVWGTSTSASLSSTIRPATTPTAPRDVVAVRGDRSARLAWNSPTDSGGENVTDYTVRLNGIVVCHTTSTNCAVSGLTNGTPVAFTVDASNVVGSSSSTPSNTIVPA